MPQKKPSFWLSILMAALGIVVLAWHELSLAPDGKLHIAFFDVGQGDSAFITTPGGKQILIDGGPDWAALAGIGRHMPFFDRSIDLLVVSHPNLDHFQSFPEILKRYDIDAVMITGVPHGLAKYEQFLLYVHEQDIEILEGFSGNDIDLGDGAVLSILWPPRQALTDLSVNDTSIVARLSYNNHSALFTGDIEKTVEGILVKAGAPIASEIVKVPHHGSLTSSSMEFITAVNPKLAVISVGKDNGYRHPRPEVVARYRSMAIPLHRTDEDGELEIVW